MLQLFVLVALSAVRAHATAGNRFANVRPEGVDDVGLGERHRLPAIGHVGGQRFTGRHVPLLAGFRVGKLGQVAVGHVAAALHHAQYPVAGLFVAVEYQPLAGLLGFLPGLLPRLGRAGPHHCLGQPLHPLVGERVHAFALVGAQYPAVPVVEGMQVFGKAVGLAVALAHFEHLRMHDGDSQAFLQAADGVELEALVLHAARAVGLKDQRHAKHADVVLQALGDHLVAFRQADGRVGRVAGGVVDGRPKLVGHKLARHRVRCREVRAPAVCMALHRRHQPNPAANRVTAVVLEVHARVAAHQHVNAAELLPEEAAHLVVAGRRVTHCRCPLLGNLRHHPALDAALRPLHQGNGQAVPGLHAHVGLHHRRRQALALRALGEPALQAARAGQAVVVFGFPTTRVTGQPQGAHQVRRQQAAVGIGQQRRDGRLLAAPGRCLQAADFPQQRAAGVLVFALASRQVCRAKRHHRGGRFNGRESLPGGR